MIKKGIGINYTKLKKKQRKIHIQNGGCEESSLYPNNKIYSGQCTNILKYIQAFVINYFTNVVNLMNIIAYILCTLFKENLGWTGYNFIINLIVNFVFDVLTLLFEELSAFKYDMKINSLNTKIYDPERNEFKSKKWGDLEVGNIIFLRNQDPVPADILLLDGGEKYTSWVDQSSLGTSLQLEAKYGCGRKGEINRAINTQYFSQFTITISYSTLEDINNRKLFSGDYKRPLLVTSTTITENNMLWRGSILSHTPYVYGIILYTGEETRIHSSKRVVKRHNVLEKRIFHAFFYLIFLMIITFSICWIYLLLNKNNPQSQDVSKDQTTLFRESLIFAVGLSFSIVPTEFYFYFRIVQIYHVLVLYKTMYQKISFSSIRSVSLLGEIRGIMCGDKVLNSNKMRISNCYINELWHPVSNFNEANNLILNAVKYDTNRKYTNFFEALTLSIKFPEYMKNCRGYYAEFGPEQYYEKALNTFMLSYEYKMVRIKENFKYIINTPEGKKRYKLLIRDQNQGGVLTLVVNPEYNYELILRGSPEIVMNSLRNKISIQKRIFGNNNNYFASNLLFISKKLISIQDFEEIKSLLRLSQVDRKNKQNIIFRVLAPFIKNMKLLGICEVKYDIEPTIKIGINNLIYSGMHLYYFSNKNVENTVGFTSQLLAPLDHYLKITNIDVEGVGKFIDIAINQIKTFETSKGSMIFQLINEEKKEEDSKISSYAFGIVVSKRSTEIIINNKYCRNHFLLLVSLVKTVIFCKLTQAQKCKIIPALKKGLGNSVLLGVGCEDYDIPLLVSADISIYHKVDQSKSLVLPGVADIVIQDISLLELIFSHGYRIREHLNIWGNIIFCYMAILGYFFISMDMYTQTNANPIIYDFEYDYFLRVCAYIFFVILFPIFLFTPSRETIKCFPKFYSKGVNKFLSFGSLVTSWTIGYLSGTVYYGLGVYLLNGIGCNGREVDLYIYTCYLYLGCTWIIIGVTAMINLNINSTIALPLLLFSIFNGIIVLFIYKPYIDGEDVWVHLSQAASHTPAILFFILSIILAYITYYLYQCFPLFRNNYPDKQNNVFLVDQKLDQYQLLSAFHQNNIPSCLLKQNKSNQYENRQIVSKKEFFKSISNIFGNKTEAMEPYLEELLNLVMIWQTNMINIFTLLLKDQGVKNEYYTLFASFHFTQFRITQTFFIISNIVSLFTFAQKDTSMILSHTILSIFQAIFIVISFHSTISKNVKLFSFLVTMLSTVVETYHTTSKEMDEEYIIFLALMMLINFESNTIQFLRTYLFNSGYAVIFYISFIIVVYDQSYDTYKESLIIYSLITGLGWFLQIVHSYYSFERTTKTQLLLSKQIQHDYQKSEGIIQNLVPKFVKERIESGVRFISEDQGIVSILFCDIYNFDQYLNYLIEICLVIYSRIVASHGHNELITFLDTFYNDLDAMCKTYGIQKIETVGKTYMCCTGIKSMEKELSEEMRNKSHWVRILKMGMSILCYLEGRTINGPRGEMPLEVKIGIHSGRVIAGVVGSHKPQFSLIGDPINTTARMCALSNPNTIQVSASFHKNVFNLPFAFCHFIHRNIYVKGKGEMDTYFVEFNKHEFIEERPVYGSGESIMVSDIISNPYSPNKRATVSKISVKIDQSFNSPNSNPGNLKRKHSNILLDQINKTQGFFHTNPDEEENSSHNWDNKLHSNSVAQKMKEVLYNPKIFFCMKRGKTEAETIFWNSHLKSIVFRLRIGLIIVFIANASLDLWHLSTKAIFYEFIEFLVFKMMNDLMAIIVFMRYIKYQYIKKPIIRIILFLFLLYSHLLACTMWILISHFLESRVLFHILVGNPFMVFAFCNLNMIFQAQWVYVMNLMNAVVWFAFAYGRNTTFQHDLYIIALLMSFILSVNAYFKEKAIRASYNREVGVRNLQEGADRLVNSLMPPIIVSRLKAGESGVISERIEGVTLLFADIVGFTAYSSSVSPEEVVKMLNSMFSDFDRVCENNKVYKVHTIGDCYVIMGYRGNAQMREEGRGSSRSNINHNISEEIYLQAKRVIESGFDMIKIIKEVRDNLGISGLNMRIGIHTGNVITGIIGSDIVRYDIFGSDVLTANKMESSSCPGQILLSNDTKLILEQYYPDIYEFIPHQTVFCQGINKTYETFFVQIVNT